MCVVSAFCHILHNGMTVGIDKNGAAIDDTIANENRCVRSFIIKSIQVIVQSRSGNSFNTNCISDVGARNNLMVYLEDDPEIGATIKRTLQESNFSVEVGDRFCLDILTRRSPTEDYLIVMEVWQFALEPMPPGPEDVIPPPPPHAPNSTAAKAVEDSPTVSPGGGSSPSTSSSSSNSNSAYANKSRLFERLGTMLKSIMVLTRLLPAYQYSRKKGPSSLPLFYVIRRGEPEAERLGADLQVRTLGSLTSPRGKLHLWVHYRATTKVMSPREMVYVAGPGDRQNLEFECRTSSREAFELKRRKERARMPTKSGPYSQDCDPTDLQELSLPSFKKILEPPREEEEEELAENASSNENTPSKQQPTNQITRPPLRLPPMVNGDAGQVDLCDSSELTRFFLGIRDSVDLDLFHRCPSPIGGPGGLSDDLERHETTLREFDDFLADFDANCEFLEQESGAVAAL